ncbi:MAG: fused MFS/spermidine synthase [Vicinamibacteria bacterium]
MTAHLARGVVYLLFFLSGAAALVYQVVWVRSLTLVFGGSHLAVTVVLAIFMAGLALGGYAIGRIVDRVGHPLRLYGLLELGIAASALVFAGLMKIYPSVYVALAQGKDDSILYLLAVRTLFSIVALIVPTTLMGGTLPVLSRFVSRQPETLRRSLSFLYGLNTLGAVLGALLASFLLLRLYSVSAALYLAIATNTVIGLVSVVLQTRLSTVASPEDRTSDRAGGAAPADLRNPLPCQLVLWGIGISGFCALGYEVLWTRILTLAVGASVYGFTIMLVAFLAGIALGSTAYGLLPALVGAKGSGHPRAIVWFGIVQVVIGVTAFLVTLSLRDVPGNVIRLQGVFLQSGMGSFGVRVWGNFALAFLSMVVPAFFMGLAFPLAGEVHATYRRAVGRAVGEVLAYNTVGAILGAGISGFGLIYLFGIERSLQMLTLLNVGMGLLVLASLVGSRGLAAAVTTATLAALAFLAANPAILRIWDTNYFAIFRSNQPEAFGTPEMVREAVENTDVLYYAEGVESIVSVIRIKGGEQSFVTNGRVEASSHLQAQQVQLTLGHLPMLLARTPRKVLVVGMGSGMTVGATSVHPGVDQVTLAEIEPRVIGVARAFAAYNHHVLENPKLRIVFNDGRNFLMTTSERFDVITADPIHPWFRGAGYLYTAEYFKLAADRLSPGGVIAQWLPIYELTPQDLRSIVRTFREHFEYTLLWLTHFDAELVGSNSPLLIDEAELARRIAAPAVARDLEKVMMGSATDLLSYFVMGTDGMARFSRDGILNTDDRLYLEFSAPFSIATPSVMEANVRALAAYRESILPYLAPALESRAREEQRRRWDLQREAAGIADPALALFLGGQTGDPRFTAALAELDRQYAWYAPGRFLKGEYQAALALAPRPLEATSFALANDVGRRVVVEISAVLVPVSKTRAAVMFVDNRARFVYGQRYVDNYEGSEAVSGLVAEVMATIRAVYQKEAEISTALRSAPPPAAETLRKIHAAIASKVRNARPPS